MLETFDIVQDKYRSVTAWQLPYGFVQRQPVNVARTFRDRLNDVLYFANLAFLSRFFVLHAAFAEVHQNMIDRHAVQPGRKGGFTAKTANLAEELNEDFLRQVFGLCRVRQHAQTQAVNAAIVTLVKRLKGFDVSTR